MSIKGKLIEWARINREQSKRVIASLLELLEKLFFVIPPLVALYVSLRFINESFFKPKIVSSEAYTIILSAIGINATLSGLAFRASSSCDRDKEKKEFYNSGESLLLATIMFIFALFLKYANSGLTAAVELVKINQIIYITLNILQFFFFVGGVFGAVNGLQNLLEILLTPKREQKDKIKQ